jgi:hypothetical protein
MTKKSKPALACSRLNLHALSTSSLRCAACLVSDLDEVVGELLDGVGGRSRLDALGEVSDEDGEGGLDDDNTFLALINSARQHSNSKLPAVLSPEFAI